MLVWHVWVHGEALVGWVGWWRGSRGSRVVSSSRRIRERESGKGCCKVFLNNAQDLHGSSFSFLQTLKDKGERGLL
jgi:hypothetical protein